MLLCLPINLFYFSILFSSNIFDSPHLFSYTFGMCYKIFFFSVTPAPDIMVIENQFNIWVSQFCDFYFMLMTPNLFLMPSAGTEIFITYTISRNFHLKVEIWIFKINLKFNS